MSKFATLTRLPLVTSLMHAVPGLYRGPWKITGRPLERARPLQYFVIRKRETSAILAVPLQESPFYKSMTEISFLQSILKTSSFHIFPRNFYWWILRSLVFLVRISGFFELYSIDVALSSRPWPFVLWWLPSGTHCRYKWCLTDEWHDIRENGSGLGPGLISQLSLHGRVTDLVVETGFCLFILQMVLFSTFSKKSKAKRTHFCE